MAGFNNLEEADLVADMEIVDLNSQADKMGDDRRRTDKDSH